MRKILRQYLLPTAVLLISLISALGFWLFSPSAPPADTTIIIRPGSSLISIANELASKNIVHSPLPIRILARIGNKEANIQAGQYLFSDKASPGRVLDRLVAGDVEQISITIPEGFTLRQIAERLSERGVVERSEFLSAAHNPEFLKELGIEAESLEGYLFPETYRFAPGKNAFELLRMMVAENCRQFELLLKTLPAKPSLKKHQLLTLASIIQQETGLEEEMPLISAVFHNRLKRNILLQTDPTVIYGIDNFNGNLTRKDLQRPSAYNTYLNRGLPPGPIASPGYKALLAAAQPAESPYLYFVARGDGSHQFSETLKEHNLAVRQYQLRRK
jgi:UPF0755 protein